MGIQRTEKGIDLQELERIFEKRRFVFSIRCQGFKPAWNELVKTREKERLHFAEKYDVYIVEDDYIADLEFDAKKRPDLFIRSGG
ncbi:hypothetical protein ACEQPO_02650 [Bacillus sp. SL00103]